MSRIEQALEKAASLRDAPATAEPAPAVKRTTVHVPPPALKEAMKVANQVLVSATNPHTPAAEEYRKLKSVVVSETKSPFRNLLMVTSSVSSEGKSVTALNLALTLAQEYDHTVLLVDCDLRKPSAHRYLGLKQGAGLSECLNDRATVEEALVKTGIGRLSLLPAGTAVRNPTELLSSQKAKEFFLEMKHRYSDRYIIFDTPPVLPFAESRSLGTFVDGVLLVVKEGCVSLHTVKETLSCLKETPILGIVYNQASVGHETSHYYYYQHKYACVA